MYLETEDLTTPGFHLTRQQWKKDLCSGASSVIAKMFLFFPIPLQGCKGPQHMHQSLSGKTTHLNMFLILNTVCCY
uniref:Uncharacterized protein n=1 Tax=Junco hyemalis TaxID=40217 RepID=A0A8C5J0T6_JUNHY